MSTTSTDRAAEALASEQIARNTIAANQALGMTRKQAAREAVGDLALQAVQANRKGDQEAVEQLVSAVEWARHIDSLIVPLSDLGDSTSIYVAGRQIA